MLFSIIVPIYNIQNYIEECVNSIIRQHCQDWELILVNDGSTDHSAEICDKLSQKDKKIIVIHKKNGGLSDARNTGLKIAKGQYVIFLDGDDYYTGECLQEWKQLLEKKPGTDILLHRRMVRFNTGVIKKNSRLFDTNKIWGEKNTDVLEYLLKESLYEANASLKVLRRDMLLSHNLYFQSGIISEDVEWFLRTIQYAQTYGASNKQYYIYRKGRENSITTTINSKSILDGINIASQWSANFQSINFPSPLKKEFDNYFAFIYSNAMIQYSVLKKEKREDIKKIVLENKWLLDKASHGRANIIKSSVKWIGFNNTLYLLKILFLIIRKMGK